MEINESAELYEDKQRAEKCKVFSSVIEILESFIYAIAFIAILFTFFARVSIVDGTSMENTLLDGDYLIVSNPLYLYTPKNGDIVVIHGHFEDKNTKVKYYDPIVKRVIAVGGQTVKIDCRNCLVYVDDELLDEDYAKYIVPNISVPTNSKGIYDSITGIFTATVPQGYVFVMGDNRYVSLDSRYDVIGFVDEDFIVGKVNFRVFPFDKAGKLD